MKEEISKEDLLLMVKQLDLSLDARMNPTAILCPCTPTMWILCGRC